VRPSQELPHFLVLENGHDFSSRDADVLLAQASVDLVSTARCLRTGVRVRHNLLDLISRDDSLVAVKKMVCIVLVAFLFVFFICVIIIGIVDSYRESAPAYFKPTFGPDALQAPRQVTRSQVRDGLFDSIDGVFSSV
jgi:hypothetical protein